MIAARVALVRVALIGICIGGAGCAPAPHDTAQDFPGRNAAGSRSTHPTTNGRRMDGTTDRGADGDTAARLIGRWRKSGAAACAALYPAALRFEASGLYRGTPEPPGQFSTWDVGTWRVDGAALAISTATDAVVRYRYTLTGDDLQFVDDAGCAFGYRREG